MFKLRAYHVFHIARITLGAIFFVMGINGFFKFLEMEAVSQEGQAFIQALSATEFFWPLEKFLEVVFGLMLLCNRFVPLAAEGLAPIVFNILFFHLFLDIHGLALALVVFVCEVIIMKHFWSRCFSHIFQMKWD